MQGIALGHCRKSDGMIFHSPQSKELYTSSNYKLDEGHHTPTAFNRHYDEGIFFGLYIYNSSSSFETFLEGTSVSYPTRPNPNFTSTVVKSKCKEQLFPFLYQNNRLVFPLMFSN